MNGFANVQGCTGPLPEFGNGYGCDASVKIRRLTIWGPDMVTGLNKMKNQIFLVFFFIFETGTKEIYKLPVWDML